VSDGFSMELDLRELAAEASRIKEGLSDFTTPARWGFRAYAVNLYAEWSKMRRGGGSFRGKQWEPLCDETRPEKPNAVINQDSGQLLRAVLKMDPYGKKIGEPTVQDKCLLLIGDDLPPYGLFAMTTKGRELLFFIPSDVLLFAKALDAYLNMIIQKKQDDLASGASGVA
jgi:hypothetical protein